ncbi:hypothetical protein CEE45_05785 [Candidatus Heimdallarchaeota archaeon B3_Heim]|nr:MAG: hypothetical protein CEE45_05785 [Candidatus Heimdallarchaeota archaeon B3_Heim]
MNSITKTSANQILEDVGIDLMFYLKQGLRFKSGCNKLNLNFSQADLIKLLRIQFLFQDDVLDFLNILKKETKRIGHISTFNLVNADKIGNGAINWQKTLNLRAKSGFTQKNLYAINEPEKYFETKENLVLIKLLQNLRDSFNEINFALKQSYEWTQQIRDSKLWDKFRFVYYRNPYLTNITQKKVTINPRTIQIVKKSRKKLYRRAAFLQEWFHTLRKHIFIEKDLSKFLEIFIVNPDQISVLFELYWIIQTLKVFNDQKGFQIIMKPHKGDQKNLIATWEANNLTYQLFHNSLGNKTFFLEKAEFNSLLQDFDKLSHQFFFRYYSAVKKKQDLIVEAFKDENLNKNVLNLWTGRPDVLIEAYNSDSLILEKILIVEVKYSRKLQYIYQGLEQLLIYLALIRRKRSTKYLLSRSPISTDLKVSGMLCFDKLENNNVIEINNRLKELGEPIRLFEYQQDLTSFLTKFADLDIK